MNPSYNYVFKGFLISSFICFIISMFSSSGNATFNANITGYSLMSVALCLLLIELFRYKLVMTIIPIAITLLMIGLILYSMIMYKSLIINKEVSSSYETYSFVGVSLVLIQSLIIYFQLDSKQFLQTHKISPFFYSLLYLIDVFLFACALIIFVILKYYTTEGFNN